MMIHRHTTRRVVHTTTEMRERMFTMRLSEEESARLDRVAAHYGLNAANLIRMLLTEKDREIAAETMTGPIERKPKKR